LGAGPLGNAPRRNRLDQQPLAAQLRATAGADGTLRGAKLRGVVRPSEWISGDRPARSVRLRADEVLQMTRVQSVRDPGVSVSGRVVPTRHRPVPASASERIGSVHPGWPETYRRPRSPSPGPCERGAPSGLRLDGTVLALEPEGDSDGFD